MKNNCGVSVQDFSAHEVVLRALSGSGRNRLIASAVSWEDNISVIFYTVSCLINIKYFFCYDAEKVHCEQSP